MSGLMTGRGRATELTSPRLVAPTPRPRSDLRELIARAPVAWAALVGSLGLLVQCVGYALGWAGLTTPALWLYYVGLTVLIASFAVLLTARGLSGRRRLTGALVYAEMLYLSWLLSDPVLAARFDETLHVATLLSLTDDPSLFSANAMLPVSPHYPGLELAAAGIHWTTGLPLMACQVLVVAISRAVLVLALFWLGTRIGRSSRVGAVLVLLYSASSQFYFFNAQFSYQTVAIALLVAACALLLQAIDATGASTTRAMVAAQVCLAGVAITHHLTSWLTLAALWLLAGLFAAGGERRRARLTLVTAEIGTVVAAAWTAVIAPLLLRYLGPLVDTAGAELVQLLTMDSTGSRAVLEGNGSTPTPLWEVGVMATSILIWCLVLLPAGWGALRGTTMSRTSGRLALLALAAAYPLLFLARFFPTSSEVADRASTFVAMALAVVVALWVAPRLEVLRSYLVPAALVLVLGGVILGGGPDWQRTPGPYLPGAEQRSVDADTVAFARWAGQYLPAGSRVASDVTLDRVLPDFGPIVPVTQQSGNDNLTPVFIAPTVDDRVISLLQDNEVDFVVVDTRTIGQLAMSGSYYEAGSSFGEAASRPTRQMLEKFSAVPGSQVVLDTGPITVIDVRGLRGEPQTFVDRGDPGLPGGWNPWQVALGVALLAGLLWSARASLGAALRRSDGESLWLVCISLPALMVLGAVSVALGADAVRGSAVLVVVTGAAILLVRRRGAITTGPARSPAGQHDRLVLRPVAALAALVLVTAVSIAVASAWQGLTSTGPLPAPAVAAAGASR